MSEENNREQKHEAPARGKARQTGAKPARTGTRGGQGTKPAREGTHGGQGTKPGREGTHGGQGAKFAPRGTRGGQDAKPAPRGPRGEQDTKPARPGTHGGQGAKPAPRGPHGGGSAKPGYRTGPYGKPAPKKPAEMEGLASRRIALKVIREVTEEGAYASLSLDRALQGSGLNAADRRLVTRLVYDTLDRMIWLDYQLSQVMAREDTDIKLRNILRLGACQILIEDRIPESAATNTCVALCAETGMEGLKGVCNGILRNLIRKKDELVWPDAETEPDRAFSVRCSLPEWLGKRLREEYGDEEAERIATWRAGEPAITLRPNMTRVDAAEMERILGRKIWGRQDSLLENTWRITGAMDIARDADFTAGNFSIQSESSIMACLAVGARRGAHILDCCAAPGGKTCYLAETMGGTGRVQAWDIHPHRVELIAAQAKRLGLENIRPVVRDAAKPREDLNRTMDAVLLDAPCSGLGVIAEKPDIKLRVSEESVRELTALQARLLGTVCEYVREGGTLVYSTCSILREENEDQIRAFLARHPEFEILPLPETIPERFRQHQGTGLQLLPHRDGVEGFYICRMRRKADL